MSQNIKKDYIWNTIGVFAQNAISPLLLIAVTRINGIYDSGIFSFAFSLSLILWAVGMWGGRTYQVSDVKREFSHHSYIFVRLILGFAVIIAAIIFSILNQYEADKMGIILALVVFKVVESISDAIYGIFQVHDRLYVAGRSLFYKAVLGLVSFVVTDLMTHDILLSCVAVIAVNVLVVIAYDLVQIRQSMNMIAPLGDNKLAIMSSFRIIKKCAPIALIICLTMFSLNIPRYFIDLYRPVDVGPFGIIAMPITLIALLITFILQPNITQLSKLFNKRDYKLFKRIVNKLVGVSISIGVLVFITTYLIGVELLHFVFGIDFVEYREALLVIVAGGVLNAVVSIYVNILTIMRYFKAQFYILLLTNIILAIASVSVIQRYGLLGGVTLYSMVNLIQMALLFGAYRASFAVNPPRST